MGRVAVIDYGMGNLHSVSKALESVGAQVVVTTKAADLEQAERIVLPGVGAFPKGMQHLRELNLIGVLREQVVIKKKPFLGICLGMQLTAATGEEHGTSEGLGWFKARVVKFQGLPAECKVPHMGWNDVEFTGESPLFQNLKSMMAFYFVHSYHFIPEEKDIITGTCDHGGKFVAAVSRENIHLVQFHPEKSQTSGLKVLENFLQVVSQTS